MPAAADPFGELPFRPVPGVATCLRATGVPGVTVLAGAPNGHRIRSLHVRVAQLVRGAPAVPAPLDVRGRRRGADAVVGWRVAFAGRHVFFVVSGSRSRRGPPVRFTSVDGGRARRFSARLHDAARVRYVTGEAVSSAGRRTHGVTVPVTG